MESVGEALKKIANDTVIGRAKLESIPAMARATSRSGSDQTGPGAPDCPYCQGVGYIREDVPIEHPSFGKLFVCSCRYDEIEAAKAKRQIDLSNLGPLANRTFDNFDVNGHASNPEQRKSLARAFSDSFEFAQSPKGWLLLMGGYGCGKTHLAAAIANACISRHQTVMFVNAPDLLDHLRAAFRPGADTPYDELFEKIRNAPLLIIDDLGAESPTQWAQEKLYQIFNHRYNANLPTVVTSNVEMDRFDPRIRSRLSDRNMVNRVVINSPDFRRDEWDRTSISSLPQHRNKTFSTFDMRKSNVGPQHLRSLEEALTASKEFAQLPKGWLILVGAPGCGKTHLAAAIANYRDMLGHPTIFVTFADLLDHLRYTFSPDSYVRYDQRFNELKQAPLLVLDDLQVESATPWAREKLVQLIDSRYVNELPTVITTNHYRDEIDDWLQSRLLDDRMCRVCVITAPKHTDSYKSPRGYKRSGSVPRGSPTKARNAR